MRGPPNRADRRRQRREDEQLIRRGLDATGRDAEQVFALMRVLRDKVRSAVDRGSVNTLMGFLYENMTAGEKFVAVVPVACAKGCSHCCHIWVDAMPPEVFYTVGRMGARQRQEALDRVNLAMAETDRKTFAERGGMVTPCPLLADNLCSIYPSRPINCRTAVSADASICERSYLAISGEDIPTPAVWFAVRQGYGFALQAALENAGLVASAREWNRCLHIALTEPDAEARWLAGEDVFAGAEIADELAGGSGDYYNAMYQEAFGEPR